MTRAFLTRTIAKTRNLWRSRSSDAELEREIATHVALLEEEYERRGMSPEGAHRAARQALGGVEQAKQSHRDERGILWLEQTRQDLRQACRTFARNPGFTLVAVVHAGSGHWREHHVIHSLRRCCSEAAADCRPRTGGAAGALVHPRMARRHAVWIFVARVSVLSRASGRLLGFSGHQLACARTCASYHGDQLREAQPKNLQGQMVSGNYFSAFGVEAGLGRTFGPDEDRAPGADPVVVLSHPSGNAHFMVTRRLSGAGEDQRHRVHHHRCRSRGVYRNLAASSSSRFLGSGIDAGAAQFPARIGCISQLTMISDARPAEARIALKQAEAETAALDSSILHRPTSRANRHAKVTLQHTAFFGNTDESAIRSRRRGSDADRGHGALRGMRQCRQYAARPWCDRGKGRSAFDWRSEQAASA